MTEKETMAEERHAATLDKRPYSVPSANEVIKVLERHFGASRETIIGWLMDMNF